jgi:hypothetical protein
MSLHRIHYYYSVNQPLHLLHASQIRNKHQVHSLWFAQSGLEPTIYYTRCKHANYYFINAVFKVLWPTSIYIPVKCQPIINAPIATWRIYLCNNSFFLYSSLRICPKRISEIRSSMTLNVHGLCIKDLVFSIPLPW